MNVSNCYQVGHDAAGARQAVGPDTRHDAVCGSRTLPRERLPLLYFLMNDCMKIKHYISKPIKFN